MSVHDERNEPASPVCFMEAFAAELLPGPPPLDWPAVQALRKEQRAERLTRRAALSLDDRKRLAAHLTANLTKAVELRDYAVLGFYWPIRGEPDLRGVAQRHVAAGGTAALPVVVAKSAPVEFWQWRAGASMRRGFWNIPTPAERRPVVPDILLIPLVGYDEAGYRLGYGGGYYDRTLASLTPLPVRIGVGYDDAALATIEPQAHDVPMSMIVTESRVLRFDR